MSPATMTAGLRRVSLPRLSVRRLGVLLVVAAILFGAWLWLRSSSLVGIRQVQVKGLSGADAAQVRTALVNEALTMTTLNASTGKLEAAVSNHPYVSAITLVTHFPHGLTINVSEQIPVATVKSGGTSVEVDGAGQALPSDHAAGLPTVGSLASRAPLAVLGAAPYQLLPHITSAVTSTRHGVIVQLRNGPQLYFGPASALKTKWQAAVAALANTNSRGAAYIDVSDPGRPAAGA